ncbi:hypothetical protein H5410_045671 [Solanum commersonii]|uniref:Uncharacterized protein n=1 Tax=Solanum commersonii TaxID=4109 RepID=A0A9J5XCA0_SOLCO|nr:hypothetical protein H5410_045671 [Solanum commersonii]
MILKSNGYKELNLDLRKGRRMDKTHFQLGEDEILLSSGLPKTLSKFERKYPKKYYSITSENSVGRSFGEFVAVLHYPSAWSCFVSLGELVLLHRIIQRNADYFFHRPFYPAPSKLCVLEQRATFLRLSVHVSTKTSNS